MLTRSRARQLLTCVGLSAAALVAAVAVQGAFFFLGPHRDLNGPRVVEIRRVAPLENGRRALVLSLEQTLHDWDAPRYALSVCRVEGEVRPHQLDFDFVPWMAAASRLGSRLFLVSADGDVYS